MSDDSGYLIAGIACLVLVGSALLSRRLPGRTIWRYTLGWLAILAAVVTLVLLLQAMGFLRD